MQTRVVVVLASALILGSGCKDSPLEPTSLAFQGSLAGQAVFTGNPRSCATGWSAVLNASATLNAPFGQSTWHGEHCLMNPQTGQVGSGVFTLTRADGMQATGTYVGTVAVGVAPGGQAPLELTLTISGGTGQLLTASGSGSMKVTLTPGPSGLVPWPFTGTIEGTMAR